MEGTAKANSQDGCNTNHSPVNKRSDNLRRSGVTAVTLLAGASLVAYVIMLGTASSPVSRPSIAKNAIIAARGFQTPSYVNAMPPADESASPSTASGLNSLPLLADLQTMQAPQGALLRRAVVTRDATAVSGLLDGDVGQIAPRAGNQKAFSENGGVPTSDKLATSQGELVQQKERGASPTTSIESDHAAAAPAGDGSISNDEGQPTGGFPASPGHDVRGSADKPTADSTAKLQQPQGGPPFIRGSHTSTTRRHASRRLPTTPKISWSNKPGGAAPVMAPSPSATPVPLRHCDAKPFLDNNTPGIPLDRSNRYLMWKYPNYHVRRQQEWPVRADGVPPVTLTTQLSVNRISQLAMVARKWNGPISAAMSLCHVSELETAMKEFRTYPELVDLVNLHIVVGAFDLYPINSMRNVGVDEADTDWVFVVDCDAHPNSDMWGLAADLHKSALAQAEETGKAENTAYVIPAFEFKVSHKKSLRASSARAAYNRAMDLSPKFVSKEDLLQMYLSKEVTIMHPNTQGYKAALDETKWFAADKSFQLKYEKNFEPYFAAKRPLVPFDERFIGRGTNKIALFFEMFAADWSLRVVNESFVIDTPHVGPVKDQGYEYTRAIMRAEFLHDVAVKHNLKCSPNVECFWENEFNAVVLKNGKGGRHFKSYPKSWAGNKDFLEAEESERQAAVARYKYWLATQADTRQE